MILSPNKCPRPLILALIFSLIPIFFWSCANVQHQATFDRNYLPKEDVRIKVTKVVNDTGYTFDVDIEQMLTNTLEEQLMEENLLNLGKTEPNLFMESRIIGYKKGSAFKRWMMPGWGATELSIRCDLKDGNNNVVGTATSSQEIVAGGLYTVGAWETIFNDVANAVAEDLKDQIEAQGYAIKPKTGIQATTVKKDIEPGAEASVRPKEVQELTTTPEIDPTKKAIDKPEEEPKLASIPKEAAVIHVSLRRQPKEISDLPQITDMLMEYDFFDQSKNAYGSFVNDFVDNNDGTVTDRATRLMWQKGGSKGTLDNSGAKRYIKQINKQRFAGYSDWRMPTVEELASLLEKSKINGLHFNPLFSSKQIKCWTIDQAEGHDRYYLGGWIVNFELGEVTKAEFLGPSFVVTGSRALNPINYIKAVRSVK